MVNLEFKKSYLVQEDNVNYRSDIQEWELIKTTDLCYKFARKYSSNEISYSWLTKEDFHKRYEIIEEL